MHPSIDLFGLILLNLCFLVLKIFPPKYAKVSVTHAQINTYHIRNIPLPEARSIGKNIKNTGI